MYICEGRDSEPLPWWCLLRILPDSLPPFPPPAPQGSLGVPADHLHYLGHELKQFCRLLVLNGQQHLPQLGAASETPAGHHTLANRTMQKQQGLPVAHRSHCLQL